MVLGDGLPVFRRQRHHGPVRRASAAATTSSSGLPGNSHDYQPFATESPDEAVLTRVDRIRNYGVDFGYRLKRETRIGFGVSWWDRESTYYPFRAYEDIRMGLTMAYEL